MTITIGQYSVFCFPGMTMLGWLAGSFGVWSRGSWTIENKLGFLYYGIHTEYLSHYLIQCPLHGEGSGEQEVGTTASVED